MYDVMFAYLNFDPDDKAVVEEIDRVLLKMDELLKEHSWEYTGFRNMYRPVEGTDPDETYHDAESAVLNAEWLKPYNPRFWCGMLTNACDIEKIIVVDERPVPEEKIKRYSDYYDCKKEYAHDIIVDENKVLRDGYTTYLLSKGNGRRANIVMVRSGQIFKKAVRGRFVNRIENGFKDTDERDVWYYELAPAVIPGDILRVDTDGGVREICVEKIFYLAGSYECGIHKNVIEHTGLSQDSFMKKMCRDEI